MSISFSSFFGQEITVTKACFSTKWEDYGPRIVDGKMYCLSAALEGDSAVIDPFTLLPFSDLYLVNGCKLVPATFHTASFGANTSMSSTFYDGPLTGNAKVLFFTNNHSTDETRKLGIFYAIFKDGKWSDAHFFPFNSQNYNVSHPFYDEKNAKLYFISDKDNLNKDQDIYSCTFDGEHFGVPSKLTGVNSDKNEIAPYVYKDTLYFSSNGFGSKGGYDVFKYIDKKVVALSPVFNSTFDDFGIIFENDSIGYFASDRGTSGKDDDIYKFEIKKPVSAAPIILASTIETQTAEQALKALIKMKDSLDLVRSKAIKDGVSPDVFSFLDLSLAPFSLNFPASYEGKGIDEINSKIDELKAILNLINQQIDMVQPVQANSGSKPKNEINVDVVNSIIDQTKIENIHFKFDSYEITPEYQTYLRGLALLLKANPAWNVQLEGHTDNVGSAPYNLELSKNRALSTKKFIESCGILNDRITYAFYGVTQPIATNSTPEGRFKNRRVDIKITQAGKTLLEGQN